ncbi:MAG: RsmE family RNA methyltransferase [Bacteroidota bacterium]
MDLPFFYLENWTEKKISLNEDTSKHIISVLRMQSGEQLQLTNGKGTKAKAVIVEDNRKRCTVEIVSVEEEKEKRKIAIAISLIKNTSRFEWFLEKATEIGVSEIIPLICERTEKEKFRFERLQQILVSAMLQSQQCWLPVLHQPTDFAKVLQLSFGQKFIAHCVEDEKQQLSSVILQLSPIILIGPEGDFTKKEIELALENNFRPVALGGTRLRTETAGIVAATFLAIPPHS